MKALIEVNNLVKSYGSLQVLKGVDLCINQGELLSIVGSSGAGKTTLLQILGTLSDFDSGKVLIDGNDISLFKQKQLASFRNKKIGFVFQFHHLLPEFTALENVAIPALIAGTNKKDAYAYAEELLVKMNLKDRLTHKPSKLSGGEQQRVAIARAMVNRPLVLLADEPSGNLDSKNKQEIHKIFFDMRDEFNQTVVLVTHDESLAESADRKIVMVDGRVSE
ncbi:MAG: ABC transporter ATP-binding protein [Rikenellaceae bacterium]